MIGSTTVQLAAALFCVCSAVLLDMRSNAGAQIVGISGDDEEQIILAQARCPRGYDGSCGYCQPNRSDGVPHCGGYGYNGPRPGGYYRRGGIAACPRGYDGSCGYCQPNRPDGVTICGGGYQYRPYRGHGAGVPCPRGYDGSCGYCLPNRPDGRSNC